MASPNVHHANALGEAIDNISTDVVHLQEAVDQLQQSVQDTHQAIEDLREETHQAIEDFREETHQAIEDFREEVTESIAEVRNLVLEVLHQMNAVGGGVAQVMTRDQIIGLNSGGRTDDTHNYFLPPREADNTFPVALYPNRMISKGALFELTVAQCQAISGFYGLVVPGHTRLTERRRIIRSFIGAPLHK